MKDLPDSVKRLIDFTSMVAEKLECVKHDGCVHCEAKDIIQEIDKSLGVLLGSLESDENERNEDLHQ